MKFILRTFAICLLFSIAHAGAPIKDLRISGTSVIEGGTFTIQTGVVVTAAAGSTVDLSAGTLTLAAGQIGWASVSKTGSSLADLATRSAGDLSSGTLPDARFPATLPAASGVNLTNLTAGNLTGTLPALSGASLTSLNASNLSSGTTAIARGGTGTGTAPTTGQLLIGKTAGTYQLGTITAGTNVTVTNGDGTITIAAAGSSTSLATLSDATITSPSNGQLLTYNSTSSKWVNAPPGAFAWNAVPASEFDTGTAGQMAYDINYLYVCVATNTWKRTALSAYTGGTLTLTYSSDGDANGAMYFAGTNYGLTAWTNPHTAGYVTIVNTTLAGGATADFVDRTANLGTFLANTANDFVGVDLGSGRTLTPTKYSIRNRADDATNLPRNWKLQGTNAVSADTSSGFASATWTDLDTQTSNATITAASGWASCTVTGAGAYRYLRVIQTGLNSSGANYFTIAEVEFYGTLSY